MNSALTGWFSLEIKSSDSENNFEIRTRFDFAKRAGRNSVASAPAVGEPRHTTSREALMRIGKQDQPFSAISTSTPETINVRGRDLCRDIIGKMDFTSYFWLLVTGREPDERQRFFANAVLTAIAEHGLVPSVVAARMTYAAAPEAFQGAVAAGLLGCGSVVLGSAELAGRFLGELVASRSEGESLEEAALRGVRALRAEKKAIPGFGHPLHAGGDPRANLLLRLAEERGASADHIGMLYAVREAIPEVLGRSLPINVNGAIPAVMLDVGYPLQALKGISLLARTASLIGHLQEEAERSIGFVLSGKAAEAISYDGPEVQD
jgi:citrate synthase